MLISCKEVLAVNYIILGVQQDDAAGRAISQLLHQVFCVFDMYSLDRSTLRLRSGGQKDQRRTQREQESVFAFSFKGSSD